MIHYVILFTESTIPGGHFTEHWYKKFPDDTPLAQLTTYAGDTGIEFPTLLETRGYIRNPHLTEKDSVGFSIEEMIENHVSVLTGIFRTAEGKITRLLRYELVYSQTLERKPL